jgi:hypothetical protein
MELQDEKKEKIVPNTELDDSILKRTDPRINAHLYQLLNVFHEISKKFNIRYWAECGTILGYKRHGGRTEMKNPCPGDQNFDMKRKK